MSVCVRDRNALSLSIGNRSSTRNPPSRVSLRKRIRAFLARSRLSLERPLSFSLLFARALSQSGYYRVCQVDSANVTAGAPRRRWSSKTVSGIGEKHSVPRLTDSEIHIAARREKETKRLDERRDGGEGVTKYPRYHATFPPASRALRRRSFRRASCPRLDGGYTERRNPSAPSPSQPSFFLRTVVRSSRLITARGTFAANGAAAGHAEGNLGDDASTVASRKRRAIIHSALVPFVESLLHELDHDQSSEIRPCVTVTSGRIGWVTHDSAIMKQFDVLSSDASLSFINVYVLRFRLNKS